jgi:cytochrome b subunit of formate dehydrogenase
MILLNAEVKFLPHHTHYSFLKSGYNNQGKLFLPQFNTINFIVAVVLKHFSKIYNILVRTLHIYKALSGSV